MTEHEQAFIDVGLDGLLFNMMDSQDLESVRLAGATLAPLFA